MPVMQHEREREREREQDARAEDAGVMDVIAELLQQKATVVTRFRPLSVWECFVQLTKHFRVYTVLRKIYRTFKPQSPSQKG